MDEAEDVLRIICEDPNKDVSKLLEKYQERPNLLDPVIPELIRLLTTAFLAAESPQVLRTIYVIARIRGYKLVLQYFPVDLQLVPRVLTLLESSTAGDWQAQYSLLLWMSCLVLIPFDLEVLSDNTSIRLVKLCKPLLQTNGIQRDASALLIARLFTRTRDLNKLDQFYHDSVKDSIGTLQVLAMAMDRVSEIPECIRTMIEKEIGHLPPAAHTFKIKILGRATVLDAESYAELVIAQLLDLLDDKSTRVRTSAAKYIARIAAKVASELEQEEQQEAFCQIWDAVLTPMRDCTLASSNYWSGALFAQAEMIRQLPPGLFDETVLADLREVLQDSALHFVQNKIQSQGGSNVRDTACYVCWSLFRYIPKLTIRDSLFESLIALALLDSEVAIRRAAAAALQEGLGRQSAGLSQSRVFEIMEAINFHSVSLVEKCYLEILPQFWLPDYTKWLLRHGCFNKSAEIRRLAGKAAPMCGRRDLMNALLSAEIISSRDIHGQSLALKSLYCAGYRDEKVVDLVRVPAAFDPELVYEAMLQLAVVSHNTARTLLSKLDLSVLTAKMNGRCWSEKSATVQAAIQLVSWQGSLEILEICTQRMEDSPLFVACVAALSERFAIEDETRLKAMNLENPESRVYACKFATQGSLLQALNDYSVDSRGDVGSWVRSAALAKIEANEEILPTIWRLAGEANEKVSREAMEVLGVKFETSLEQCPERYREDLVRGFISLPSAPRLLKVQNHALLVEEILKLKRDTFKSLERALRALRILVVARSKPALDSKRVLAVAYNATMRHGMNDATIFDAIDILSVLAPLEPVKTRTRLLNVVKKHPHGVVRQRAADAVYELDLDFGDTKRSTLTTVDWTQSNWNAFVQYLD